MRRMTTTLFLLATAACASEPDPVEIADQSDPLTGPQRRGRDIWFESTFGGEAMFTYLANHPDPAKRIEIGFRNVLETPRDRRFDDWGVINDPDCVANPAGGLDLCADPEASGVVGIRKFEQPDGSYAFGVACASCHAGFDPLTPPANPNDPSWENIHPSIGNQYLKTGDFFTANMALDDERRLMFLAWPDGTVDTTLIFNDHIVNPGVFTAFWNWPERPLFENGTADGADMRNGQGGEDDIGPGLAAVRVYTNIGACFFECSQPAILAGTPIDDAACRATCPDYPAQQDLDDLGAFLSSIRSPKYPGTPTNLLQYERGRRVFASTCASCHAGSVLSNDLVTPLTADPLNTPNECRALSTNWEEGGIWADYSSPLYKQRAAAGGKGYRTMPLVGIWATAPFFHNQSIGGWAPADATPAERAAAYENAMWELLSPVRVPKINLIPFTIGAYEAGTAVTTAFSVDPLTGATLCDDVVENKGHHYGSTLLATDKAALIYWLKYQ